MFKNVFAQSGRTVITILLGFIMPSLMNHYLGTHLYGTWQSLISLTGFVQLLALGVPMASVRFLSQSIAKKDDTAIQKIISTCLGIYSAVGLIALMLGFVFVFMFDQLYGSKIADDTLRNAALWATAIVGFSNAISFLLRFPFSIMISYGHFVQLNLMNMAMMFIKTSFMIAILVYTKSIVYIAILELCLVLGDFLLGYFFLKKKHSNFNLGISSFNKDLIAPVLCFGGYILLLNMGQKLSFQIDALVIGKAMTLDKVAFYAVCNTLLVQLIEFMLAIAGVIMPEAAKLDAAGKRNECEAILLKWSKISFSIALFLGLYLLVVGPNFIGVWMNDPTFVIPAKEVLPILVLSSFVFLPVRAVAMPVLFGFGEVKRPAVGFLISGLVNLALSLLLVKPFGLAGVALGTALPNVIFSVYILIIACKSIGISLLSWFNYVTFKNLVGGIPILLVLIAYSNTIPMNSIGQLALVGGTASVLMLIMSYNYIYKNDMYIDLDVLRKSIMRKVGL